MRFPPIASLFCVLSLAALSLAGCTKNDQAVPAAQSGEFDVEFEPTAGAAPLVLSAQAYTTPAGDQLTVSKFRYYVSHIVLTRADGTRYVQPESYYLVDAAAEASQHLAIKNVPTGDYTGITFTVGVDSARSASGPRTGALDAGTGMFWNPDAGYIYAQLAGRSPQSPTGEVVFDIGGFQKPNNALRAVSPSFNGAKLLVRPDHTPEIHFAVDVLKMLAGPTTVRFADFYRSTTAGPGAVLMANNYAAGMFRVEHIHAN